MKKSVKSFNVNLQYNANHARAHYTIDGIHYFNGGEAVEICMKNAYGLNTQKDACGAFDVTDDIPQFGVSVKSAGATLVNKDMGETVDEIITNYMAQVHSKFVWYGILDITKKVITIYEMSMSEFEQYLRRFGKLEKSRKTVRLPKTDSGFSLAWLENKARA